MAIRRTWAEDQDFILKMLKQQKKINKWSSIARIMDIEYNLPGRTGKQCRQRYNNHLDQKIVSQEFSYENQKLLEKLHNQIGNKWAVISTHFNGRQNQFYERTANFLKNQLYSKLRKAVRRLNKFIKDHNMKKITKQFKLNIVFKIIQTNDYKFSEKQLHSKEDLYFYEEVKKNMLEYAEQNMPKQSINCKDSIYYKNNESNSKKLIELLNLFLTKFSFFKNKRKINRNYQKQDQIIINSFSNNPEQKKIRKKVRQKNISL